jgi:RNA polymerase sigma-70 factor (ECF subfamily)
MAEYTKSNEICNISQSLIQYQSSLQAYARKLTQDSNNAQDLYQETAFKILKNANKFKPGTNFNAWSKRIMFNQFINDYRKSKRKQTITDNTDNNYYINSEGKVQNMGDSNLEYDQLITLVNQLPTDLHDAFLMAYEGFKYNEIAEKLNEPLGTIKSRIFHARKALKNAYTELYGENPIFADNAATYA